MMSEFERMLQGVWEDIDAVASRVGRAGDVTLVAVSKTVPAERVREAYAAGHRVFGENRVQEGAAKIAALNRDMPDASWHLIGHLQTNKTKQAVECFDVIQSVDSVRLARRLDAQYQVPELRLRVLLEVNVANERSKSGFHADEIASAMCDIQSLEHLRVVGLMTVAPLVRDAEEVRPVFRRLRELRDALRAASDLPDLHHLSMGMSNDFRVAIEEGATIVRLGRAIFGERP